MKIPDNPEKSVRTAASSGIPEPTSLPIVSARNECHNIGAG